DRRPGGEVVVVDLHALHGEPSSSTGEPDEAAGTDWLAGVVAEAVAGAELPAAVHRVVVAAARPGVERGMSAVDLVTFARPAIDGAAPEPFAEEAELRGLHPMMAERLHLWRLANFSIERLPSAEDVYLFHGVGRE